MIYYDTDCRHVLGAACGPARVVKGWEEGVSMLLKLTVLLYVAGAVVRV